MLCSAVWCSVLACVLIQENKRHLNSITKVGKKRTNQTKKHTHKIKIKKKKIRKPKSCCHRVGLEEIDFFTKNVDELPWKQTCAPRGKESYTN